VSRSFKFIGKQSRSSANADQRSVFGDSGWIWCTDNAGEARWVPEPWVEFESDSCVVKHDYNAAEMSVEVGEVVTVAFERVAVARCVPAGCLHRCRGCPAQVPLKLSKPYTSQIPATQISYRWAI
jgi:hypothetical protein